MKEPYKNILYILDAIVNRRIPIKEGYDLFINKTKDIQEYYESIQCITNSIRDSNYSGDYTNAFRQYESFRRISGPLDLARLRKLILNENEIILLKAELIYHEIATRFYLNLIRPKDEEEIMEIKAFLKRHEYYGTLLWISIRQDFYRLNDTGFKKAERLLNLLQNLKQYQTSVINRIINRHGYESHELSRFYEAIGHLEMYISSYLADSAEYGTVVKMIAHDSRSVLEKSSQKESTVKTTSELVDIYVDILSKSNAIDSLHEFSDIKKEISLQENRSLQLRMSITEVSLFLKLRDNLDKNWKDIIFILFDELISLVYDTRNYVIVETMLFPCIRNNMRIIDEVISADKHMLRKFHKLLYDYGFQPD